MRGKAAAVALGSVLAVASSASAVGPRGVLYSGETSQGREIKLVTGRDGVPRRGAFDVVTRCTGDYKPFATSVRIERPFKRVSRQGFKEKGRRFDTDGTFSGRYRWKVEGKRKTSRKFEGTIKIEIVFRRDGRKYTTCTAADVTFKVKSERRDD